MVIIIQLGGLHMDLEKVKNKIIHKIKKWNSDLSKQWLIIPVSVTLLLSIYALVFIESNLRVTTASVQEGIAEEIVRFHVIANSDLEEDQQLKLKIKDAVVESLSELLEDSETIEETRAIIKENLPLVIEIAQKKIAEEGYDYNVTAKLEKTYFPTKTYGDMTFPPGTYEALRVEIGKAEGKNWWCVMYPPLCFVDETYSVVPKESKSKLKHVLTEKEYKELITSGKVKIKPKFKLKELMNRFTADR